MFSAPNIEAASNLIVPENLDGARLDKAIAQMMPTLSRARIKRAIDEKAVRVNGRRLPKGALVSKGDSIHVEAAHLVDKNAPPSATPEAPLLVRYESSNIAVVDKPAGQPTAPIRPGETDTLVNAVVAAFPELIEGKELIGYSVREPGILHRLDTDTSGLVVVARTPRAFETMKAALKDGRLEKTYLLVCKSDGLPDDGTIEFPIANHPKDQRRVYPCIHPRDVIRYEPRPATTEYSVQQRNGEWALVEVRVARALRHQIRAHFAAIGHPLAGDSLYGGEVVPDLDRHALHASRVTFSGGDGVESFDVKSSLPPALARLLE